MATGEPDVRVADERNRCLGSAICRIEARPSSGRSNDYVIFIRNRVIRGVFVHFLLRRRHEKLLESS